MKGILGLSETLPLTSDLQISNETMSYGVILKDLRENDIAIQTNTQNCQLAIEHLGMIEYEFSQIDALRKKDTLSKEHYIDKLLSITEHGLALEGDDSQLVILATELATLAETDIKLSLEEYEKKRRTIIDTILTGLWQSLDSLFNIDNLKEIPKLTSSLFSIDKKKIARIQTALTELKSGKRVLRKEINASASLKRSLGVYSLRDSEFTISKFKEHTAEYNQLFKDGILNTMVSSVHDSLVQSKENEITIPKHQKSIKFIERYKNLDLTNILYKDTAMIISSPNVGVSFFIAQIVQDQKDGIDFHRDLITIDSDLYTELTFKPSTVKEMSAYLDLIITDTLYINKYVKKENSQRLIKELLKNLRSNIMTTIFSAGFGIFSIKRYIRQIFLANEFINVLMGLNSNAYLSWSSNLDLAIVLLETYTVLEE